MILGSTAIFGAVDTSIFLTKSKDERIIQATQRYGEPLEKHTLTLDPFSGFLHMQSTSDAKEADIAAMIIAFLNSIAEPAKEHAIVVKIARRKELVAKTLRELTEKGLIVLSGTGTKGSAHVYSVPENSSPPPKKGFEDHHLIDSRPDFTSTRPESKNWVNGLDIAESDSVGSRGT